MWTGLFCLRICSSNGLNVNTVMNLQVEKRAGNFKIISAIMSFSRKPMDQ
jgi:hypothetical protein